MSNNRYKVLVIEDESSIRSFAKAILEDDWYDYSLHHYRKLRLDTV